jgi:hypothetical protein
MRLVTWCSEQTLSTVDSSIHIETIREFVVLHIFQLLLLGKTFKLIFSQGLSVLTFYLDHLVDIVLLRVWVCLYVQDLTDRVICSFCILLFNKPPLALVEKPDVLKIREQDQNREH